MSQTRRGSTYGTPRWVKVFGIVVVVLVLLAAVVLLLGIGGDHGPERHLPSDGVSASPPAAAGDLPPADSGSHSPPLEHGGQQPGP